MPTLRVKSKQGEQSVLGLDLPSIVIIPNERVQNSISQSQSIKYSIYEPFTSELMQSRKVDEDGSLLKYIRNME